jgi:hypothetical protein
MKQMKYLEKETFMKNKKNSPGKEAISSRSNELSLGKGPSSPRTRTTTSRSNELNLLGEEPKFLKETYVSNFFVTIIISFSFLYRLVTYH